MIAAFKEEKLIYKVITVTILAFTVIFVCRLLYLGLTALSYPSNVDSVGSIALTHMFMDGTSPYSPESVTGYTVDVNYSRPFVTGYLAVAISDAFALAPVNSHYIISLFATLLSGCLGCLIMKRYSGSLPLQLLTALTFMLCHWNNGFLSSSPDDLGLFLCILTSYVSINESIRHRPVWCAALVTLCFYTALWSALVFVPIMIYMLYSCRKDAIWLIVWTIGINAILAWFVTSVWPLYWSRAVIIPLFGYCNGRIAQSLYQALPYIVRMLIMAAIVLFFVLVDRYRSNEREWLNISVISMAAVIVLFIGIFMLPVHILTDEEIDSWNRAYEYTRMNSVHGQVYFAKCLAYDRSYGFDNDKGDCLCGNEEAVNEETLEAVNASKLPGFIKMYTRQVIEHNLSYRQAVTELVRNREYSLITIDDGFNAFDRDMLEEYGYGMIDKITVRIGNETGEVAFYTLK